MLTVDEARATILQNLHPLPATEIDLEGAAGRVLAAPITAARTVPPFRNSAMDGYAVRASDVGGARADLPVRLSVVGEVAAGHGATTAVDRGTAVRIMTGAPLPEGSDAVVPVEQTRVGDSAVDILAAVPPGKNVRLPGEDIRAGEEALPAGVLLSPARLGLLASLGFRHVPCHDQPRVAILTTGDELREPGEELQPGQITNSNRYALRGAVLEAGGIPIDVGVARDQRDEIERRIAAAQGSHLIVVSGGVSMGAYDLVREVLSERGELTFWQVALRPGRQLAFGRVHGTPVLGVPGNPVSTLVAFEIFARPAIRVLSGRRAWRRAVVRARADEAMEKAPDVEQYYRGIVRSTGDGWAVRLTGPQGSHVLRSMALANALIRIPINVRRVAAGDLVDVLILEDDAT